MYLGLIAALLASAIWGTAFIAPSLALPFTAFDFSMARGLVFGLVSVFATLIIFRGLPRLTPEAWRAAFILGFSGFSSYHLAIAYGARFAGPSLTALVVGMTPIVLAVVGNLRDRNVAWSALAGPLALIGIGLVAMNYGALSTDSNQHTPIEIMFGLLFSFIALGVWIAYAVYNADSNKLAPNISSLGWTALQGAGALCSTVLIIPLGWLSGLSHWPQDSLFGAQAYNMWFWAVLVGFGSSFVGTALWVFAARRMPIALSGQIIVFESLFAMLYAFMLEGRLPNVFEWIAIICSMAGVVWGVQVFTRRKAVLVA